MIDNSIMERLFNVFGKELPACHWFFATRQIESYMTPQVLRKAYKASSLQFSYSKFQQDYASYVASKDKPVAKAPVPKTPAPKPAVKAAVKPQEVKDA